MGRSEHVVSWSAFSLVGAFAIILDCINWTVAVSCVNEWMMNERNNTLQNCKFNVAAGGDYDARL